MKTCPFDGPIGDQPDEETACPVCGAMGDQNCRLPQNWHREAEATERRQAAANQRMIR